MTIKFSEMAVLWACLIYEEVHNVIRKDPANWGTADKDTLNKYGFDPEQLWKNPKRSEDPPDNRVLKFIRDRNAGPYQSCQKEFKDFHEKAEYHISYSGSECFTDRQMKLLMKLDEITYLFDDAEQNA